jgi:hypothetical protein
MTLEISLEERCCRHLQRLGANTLKRGQDGEPDREVLWGNSFHVWMEFKKEKTGRIRPGQNVWAKYLHGIGDHHYFIDTWEQFLVIVDILVLIYGPPQASRDRAFANAS